jgi:hypothetical protein
MNFKYLIIPDIHGRKFWRNPLEKYCDQVEHIIFLGDYFGSSDISSDTAIMKGVKS